jgi:hypothetical protein
MMNATLRSNKQQQPAISKHQVVSVDLTIEQCQILGCLVDVELSQAESDYSPHPINALKTLIDVLYDNIAKVDHSLERHDHE